MYAAIERGREGAFNRRGEHMAALNPKTPPMIFFIYKPLVLKASNSPEEKAAVFLHHSQVGPMGLVGPEEDGSRPETAH